MNLRDLAAGTGIPYDSVQAYVSGRRALSAQPTAAICRALGVSADLILFGRPMLDKGALLDAMKFLEDVRNLSPAPMAPEISANMLMEYYQRAVGSRFLQARAFPEGVRDPELEKGVWFAPGPTKRSPDTSPDTSDTSSIKTPSKPSGSG